MLIALLIQGVLGFLLVVFSFLPTATSLPFGIDGTFYQVGHWLVQLQLYVWPLAFVFKIFFLVYLPFLLTMIVLKFFLGHRAPGRDMS